MANEAAASPRSRETPPRARPARRPPFQALPLSIAAGSSLFSSRPQSLPAPPAPLPPRSPPRCVASLCVCDTTISVTSTFVKPFLRLCCNFS
nr:MAG TPA: hypothetical protein [Caudoviricetes sp.]